MNTVRSGRVDASSDYRFDGGREYYYIAISDYYARVPPIPASSSSNDAWMCDRGWPVREPNSFFPGAVCGAAMGFYKPRAPIQTRGTHSRPYDIETNLPKDVILYKYDNPKYFKRLNIFAVSQLLLWTYIAQFVYTELRDAPVVGVNKEDLQWWQRVNFGERTNRMILTFIVGFVGCSLFGFSWMYILKSVRYLVLRKGGREITLVTYTPFGENRMRTVTLDKVTCKQSREKATVHIPIKVKGDWMHHLLDIKGEFKNPQLFDFTAGLKRQI